MRFSSMVHPENNNENTMEETTMKRKEHNRKTRKEKNRTKERKKGRNDEKGKENQFWCKNPQYFLNITNPTHLKIILIKKCKFFTYFLKFL